MEEGRISENRIKAGNAFLAVAAVSLSFALWNEHEWYESLAPFATLISFVFLCAVFVCYIPLKKAVRDKELWLAAAGAAVAAVNLFIVDSGKGAWLTAADVLLVIYLADKLRVSKTYAMFMCAHTGFYFFYWTYDVKGYFKGYNTNYGGLVLITGFVFALTLILAAARKLSATEKAGARFLQIFAVFMFGWGLNIIAWYRARCALLGLAVYALLLAAPPKIWEKRIFHVIVTLGTTLGAIAVSLLYVLAGKYMTAVDIRIFYKDIISGRNLIWQDLWTAFLRSPLTGIGSSYKINVDWMEGMFEVHNGLLDILIVHGIIVFAITCILLVKRLLAMCRHCAGSIVSRSAAAAVFSILAASFMENFFIVPPFLLYVLLLIAIAEAV